MFSGREDRGELAHAVAEYFGSDKHGSHGRRINRDDARGQNLTVVDLETEQEFQDQVLTLYHWMTIAFEQGPAVKSVVSSTGRMWIKNLHVNLEVREPPGNAPQKTDGEPQQQA